MQLAEINRPHPDIAIMQGVMVLRGGAMGGQTDQVVQMIARVRFMPASNTP
jgi:hypothetical protein